MSFVSMILTNAGANTIALAANGGSPVLLTEVAVGNVQWSPTAAATALNNEVQRVNTINGGVSGNVIHLTVTDDSVLAYDVREVGLFADDGVGGTFLFAIWSGPLLVSKASGSALFIAVDVAITSVPFGPGDITIGNTDFTLPAATDTNAGLVRLATAAEIAALSGAGVVSASQLGGVVNPMLTDIAALESNDANQDIVMGSLATSLTDTIQDLASLMPKVASDEKAGVVSIATGNVVMKADFAPWDERYSGHRLYIGHVRGFANCSGGGDSTFDLTPKRFDDVGLGTVDFGVRQQFFRDTASTAARLVPFSFCWVMGGSSVQDVQINCRLDNFSARVNNLQDLWWQVIGIPTVLP